MGDSKNNKKIKIIPDLERIVPDKLTSYSSRLFQEHINRYFFAIAFIRNKIVADIACGSGYGSHLLASKGAKKVIGIDCDKKIIKYAKIRYPRHNVAYEVGDANDLSLTSKSIDVVVSFETIEHIKVPLKFIKESKRVLKKSGLLIISTPNKKYSIGDNPFHHREYNLKGFHQILSKYFHESVTFYGQRPVYKPIMYIYRLFSQILPLPLHPLLHMRPWERLSIRNINNMNDDGYVYFIAICKK